MNILVTGERGQLGSELKDLASKYSQHTFFFEGSKTLDITDAHLVESYISTNNINSVINCAAYTAVDMAETNGEKAESINVYGVENLITALSKNQGKLIHISTDYVFKGENFIPYTETQKVDPIGVYGKTKRDGEELVLNSNLESVIIRTSWLYSSYGANFVKTMLRLGRDKSELGVIFDQVGTPTFARDLAKVCLEILSVKNKRIDHSGKMYHFSNEGVASWYDFSKAIMEFAELDCYIKPIETIDYPTPAKRPYYSILNKSKIKSDFNLVIPYWRDSLKECINDLKNK